MKYQDFRKSIEKPYFKVQDLKLRKLKVFNHQLTHWSEKGYLKHLKRGIFYFPDRKKELSPELVSFLIYEPSYLSLETALNFYGLIPELVYSKTAVTTKTTRKFSNDFGNFIYRHVDPRLFFGYRVIDKEFGKFLMAEPEKALLDYFYLNLGKINNKKDIEELRINTKELKKIINKRKLRLYLKIFNIKKLNKMINLLF